MRIARFIKLLLRSEISKKNTLPDGVIKNYNKQRPDKSQKLLCLAPFNSLRLNRSGGVTPCCQNYNLDNIKNTSLKEVWFGSEYNKLREHIRKNDLSFFCDFCEIHMKNENFAGVLASTYDFHPLNENGYPSYIDFSMDSTCNLACIMCNSSLSSQINENDKFVNNDKFHYEDSFFEELKAFIPHLKSVNFSGGEPFLIGDYYKIWDLVFELNPSLPITVTTNGTVLNERVKKYLHKGKFNINLSIDSLQKECYEKIRIKAQFEKTVNNIDYFKQYCNDINSTFSLVVCPMRFNWKEIPDFIQYANKNNFILNFNIVTKPFDCAIWTLPAAEIAVIYEYFKSFNFTIANNVERNNYNKYMSLLPLIKMWLVNAIDLEKKIKIADIASLRFNLKEIISEKTINYFLSLHDKESKSFDKNKLLKNIEDIIVNTPDLLLITGLIEKMKSLPDDFLFNEFYYQNVDATTDNLCSLAYYSI